MPKDSGTAVRELEVGPFSGGINTYSDPAMIADDEMMSCINFELALDGSLRSRPPWSVLKAAEFTNATGGSTPPDNYQFVIGTGSFEGYRYVIVSSNHTGSFASYILYVEGPNEGLIAQIAVGEHTKAHRYADFIYLVPDLGEVGKGAKYDLTLGAVTVIATMPTGTASIIYKDRLWISGRKFATQNTSRLQFSDLADFDTWPGTNFFDINPGDGQSVTDLVVYQDNILVFKDQSTYVLTYDTGPAQAVLNVINTHIGAAGRNCVDVYENSVFVLQYNKLYEMSNYDFVQVSVKIPFEYDTTMPSDPYEIEDNSFKFPFWVRVVGTRALVRFYNRLYVYHLRLRGWTEWRSVDPNIQYLGPPTELDSGNTGLRQGYETYVASSSLRKSIDSGGPGTTGDWNFYFKVFKFEDRYNDSNVENGNLVAPLVNNDINCSMLSKQFDIGLGHRFKRLMHWGVDCYTGRTVTGTLIPYTVAYQVTWDQLHQYQWHVLGTWGFPLGNFPPVTQLAGGGPILNHVKFVRFPKSLRFRLLQFQVEMATVGNNSDGPAYLYTITGFISAKQLVPKAVN